MKIKYLYLLFTGLLCSLALYRSIHLDITNDEAFSFYLIDTLHDHFNTNKNAIYGTANTHWLNSLFVFFENLLLGHQPWMLRLHSLFALLLFSYSIYKLFENYTHSFLMFIPLSLVWMNNYLFDFFSLLRGYALSLAFELLAFYFIYKNDKRHVFTIYSLLSLAVMANYTCIYFLLVYMLYDIFCHWKNHSLKHIFTMSFLKERWVAILTLLWALPNIFVIKFITKDLEEGQRNGFIPDTLGVFLQRSYSIIPNHLIQAIGIFLLFGLLIFYLFYRNKMEAGWKILFHLTFMVIILIHILFIFLKIPYPFGRTSFFIVLPIMHLFSYALVFVFKPLPNILKTSIGLLFLISSLLYLFQYRNLATPIEWWQQQGIAACIKDINGLEKEHIQHVPIAMSIDHYGSYDNYYRHLEPLQNSKKVFVYGRESYDQFSHDHKLKFREQKYLLMLGDYKSFLDGIIPPSDRTFIKRYEYMKTDLWRVER